MQRRQFIKHATAAPLVMYAGFPGLGFASGRDRALPADAILLAAPNSEDDHYDDMWDELLGFYRSVIANAHERDRFFIVADRRVRRELIGARLPESHILPGNLPDIWCRDLCPVITPHGRGGFVYRPSYLERGDAALIERGYDRFLSGHHVGWKDQDLLLDGGNYCHNGSDAAIVCGRALGENGIHEAQLVRALAPLTGSEKIAILPEEEGDTLGHADGMVSWLGPDTLAVNRFGHEMRSRVLPILGGVFPGVKIIELPYEPTDEKWKGIADASGVYTNILHTRHAAYVSSFGLRADKIAAGLIGEHCDRPVIPIRVGRVTRMGGSIRCFSWQNRAGGKTPLPL